MIRKSVKRLSEKIMLKQRPKARCRFVPISSRFSVVVRSWSCLLGDNGLDRLDRLLDLGDLANALAGERAFTLQRQHQLASTLAQPDQGQTVTGNERSKLRVVGSDCLNSHGSFRC